MSTTQAALKLSGLVILANLFLSIAKIAGGYFGHSYALTADGIESSTDVLSSIVVWAALRLSLRPADKNHPFGHGKAESLAGFMVALSLFAAAAVIAYHSILEILHPNHTPTWFTLPILGLVIILKEYLFQRVMTSGKEINSRVLQNDAWHHRSDSITSGAAFIGILVSLIGGHGYEAADCWAALVACLVILINGYQSLMPSMDEVMDAAVPTKTEEGIRLAAQQVPGVLAIEKCRVRKSGRGYYMDIHVQVQGDLSVLQGHTIGHNVKDRLMESELQIADVVVHIEPFHQNPQAE